MSRLTKLVEAIPKTVPFLAPDAIERKRGRPIRVRVGANESAFGVSERALAAMQRAAHEVSHYGDPESFALREALAERLGVSMEEILVGAGIDDLLGYAVRAFVAPGDSVVASAGSYPTFAYHVRGFGGSLVTAPYAAFKHDLDALRAEAERTSAKLVYIANPDNPTGSFLSRDELTAFSKALPDGTTLILDEAYADFVEADALPALAPVDARVLRMRTFSKAHGMAGARIAFMIADRETISSFDKFRHHFGVGKISQAGALASLGDDEFLRGVVAAVREGRHDYEALGIRLGVPTLPSDTNFVSFDFGEGPRARAVLAALEERDVFVRVGAPPLDRLLRVTVGRPEERAALAEALHDVVGMLAPNPVS